MTSKENRYVRQQQVAPLGGDAQQKLAAAHVLLVGVGGLGSPVSLYLAGAGVGELTLVDPDVVSLSNLHRQILFTEADVNHSKADAAKARLNALNSEIKINAINAALTVSNADTLIDATTVVVDAADNFLVSYLLSDLCTRKRIPLVSASVISTHGYLGVFCGTQDNPAPSFRALFPNPPTTLNNCETTGVTGPSVGVIASLQAQETLKVITNDESQLLGKLLYLDLWNNQYNTVDFSAAVEPNDKADFIAMDQLAENDLLLDVRNIEELQQNPLPRAAINIPLPELGKRCKELDTTRRIVCVCQSGQRALNAANLLFKAGFENVAVTSR